MLRARAVAFLAVEETEPLVLNEELSVLSEHSRNITFNKLCGFIDPPPLYSFARDATTKHHRWVSHATEI